MTSSKILFAALAVSVSFISALPQVAHGFAKTRPSYEMPKTQNRVSYDELYSSYAEVCGGTRYNRLGGEPGGPGGHGFTYFKGMCRDESAPYPRVRMCTDEVDLTDPNSGVGISTDKMFKNVNWVAIDGRDLYLNGGLSEDEPVTHAKMIDLAKRVARSGMVRGVELHKENYTKARPSELTRLDEITAYHLIGTDFAIRFARNLFCVRIPMSQQMIAGAVDFLNELNESYWMDPDHDYEWAATKDSCAHNVHNSLAAAGIWAPKNVRQSVLNLPRYVSSIAIPAAEVALAVREANTHKVPHVRTAYEDERVANGMIQNQWLKQQPGVLSQYLPVLSNNQVFSTESDFVTGDFFFAPRNKRMLEQTLSDPIHYDMVANLNAFKSRYEAALNDLSLAQNYILQNYRDEEFRRFYRTYKNYLEQEIREIQRKLSILKAAGADVSPRAVLAQPERTRFQHAPVTRPQRESIFNCMRPGAC